MVVDGVCVGLKEGDMVAVGMTVGAIDGIYVIVG